MDLLHFATTAAEVTVLGKQQKEPSARTMLGSLEYKVMTALWKKAPASVNQVRIAVNRRRKDEWAYTTIMTVLGRLFEKGILDREQVGRAYEYVPNFTEPELIAHLSKSEVSDLIERFGDVALAQFAAVLDDASPETRQRIAQLGKDTTNAL